jgi:hypothetical protein
MAFNKSVKKQALKASGRNCCLCRKYLGTKIETHHIVPLAEGGDDSYDNCIALCFNCHAEVGHYNPNHPKGQKFTTEELKRLRDHLYQQVAEGSFIPVTNTLGESSNVISVIGNKNVVAGRDININPKVVHQTNVLYDAGGKYITTETAVKLSILVKELCEMKQSAGYSMAKARAEVWSSLKNRFKVTKYELIPLELGDDAINYLHTQINMAMPSIRKKDPELWKKKLYTSIYARAKTLGIEKEELYHIAYQNIPLKSPISSLKDLNMRDLKRLNTILINQHRRTS